MSYPLLLRSYKISAGFTAILTLGRVSADFITDGLLVKKIRRDIGTSVKVS